MAGYTHSEAVSFIWSVADLLRGTYKAHDYGKIILPLVVLRRLDQALASTKQAVLAREKELEKQGIENRERLLRKAAGQDFYNISPLTFDRLIDDETHLPVNLRAYIRGFSPNARDIMNRFKFEPEIDALAEAGILYQVIAKFVDLDIGPARVSNLDMGYVFEELIRRFAEQSNETAGEHFTPREVIRLMVDLLFTPDGDVLTQPGRIITVYDPAAGTGGMLSVAEEHLHAMNSAARLVPYAQEINGESYAICKSDMLIKGQNADNVAFGNSFTEDAFANERFDYILANPPYGVDWKGYAAPIEREHRQLGHDGRFGPGLPAKSDGQLLFVLHMISKMTPYDAATGTGGSRVAIVMNGSPLFSGAPGGGESEIRRHLIENDLLEAIVGLPESMFYNTGIHTYVWIVTNRKAPERQGKVQLIDARDLWRRMRKPLGMKRNEFSDEHIAEIVRVYGNLEHNGRSKLIPNEQFGFRRVTIERPRRARYDGGPRAADRLREHPDWSPTNVRKSDAERAGEVLSAIEQAVKELPVDGITASVALQQLKKHDDYAALLKKARGAVADALTIDDPDAPPLVDAKGKPLDDPALRLQETVPLPNGYDPADPTVDVLKVGVDEYVKLEVLPHAPEAWVDQSKTKVGYEIPFTRVFYRYQPPRPLAEIDSDIKRVEQEILQLLQQVTE